MKCQRLLILGMAVIFLSGCAARLPVHFEDRGQAPVTARLFYEHLDACLAKEGRQNALGDRVEGFPYLRTNRFLTFLKTQLDTEIQKTEWIGRLQAFDLAARRSEILTLTEPSVSFLIKLLHKDEMKDRQDLLNGLKRYSDQLLAYDRNHPDFYDTLYQQVRSLDDYSDAMRLLGMYPLVYGPVLYFVRKSYARMEQRLGQSLTQLENQGQKLAYLPDKKSKFTLDDIQTIFASTDKDSLGIYHFSHRDLEKLVSFFAPVYIQDFATGNDHSGELVWEENVVSVNPDAPAVYYYFSYAAMNRVPVFQINYVNWYPSRQGTDVSWYEEGHLDGFNFRVTLDSNGIPIMVDIVHNCGCYHFFIPKKDLIRSVKPFASQIGNPAPSWMPKAFPQKRISLHISAGGHQIRHIGVENPVEVPRKYKLVPYRELEHLEKTSGEKESIFNDQGIVKGTQRLEPLILFSAGIPEIGAMRQRSHQPTRLIGREHFDNPQIFNNHFEFTQEFQ